MQQNTNINPKEKITLINKVLKLGALQKDKVILLNKDILEIQINNFFNELINENKGKHIAILTRIVYANNEIVTLDSLKKVNFKEEDIISYINHLDSLISVKEDHYRNEPIQGFIFSYYIKNGEVITNFNKISKHTSKINDFISYYHYKLPISFEPLDYENVEKFSNYDYMVPLDNYNYIKIKYLKSKGITQCQLKNKNKLILEYQDTKIDDNTFIRKINQNKYTFILGKLELMQSERKVKFINPIKPKNNLFNFLTLDIETYLDSNNYQTPYCICIYDGKEGKIFKFYLNEYKNSDELLISAIKQISIAKYRNYNIYAHNFSSFLRSREYFY